MTLLVCEGPCNPAVRDFDVAIAAVRQKDEGSPKLLAPAWLERARSFIHTPHAFLRKAPPDGNGVGFRVIYKCDICRTERVFGRELG